MKYTQQIVEGVMNRVLYEIARLTSNVCHVHWGPGNTYLDEKDDYYPMQCGFIEVVISRSNYCDVLEIVAFGSRVRTNLDSKRPFYNAMLPDNWTDTEFIHWAQLVFQEVYRLDSIHMKAMMHPDNRLNSEIRRLAAPSPQHLEKP